MDRYNICCKVQVVESDKAINIVPVKTGSHQLFIAQSNHSLYHNIITSLACGCNRIYVFKKNCSAFFGHSSFLIAVELLTIYFSGLKQSLFQTPSARLNGNIDTTSPGKYFFPQHCILSAKIFFPQQYILGRKKRQR